MEIQTGIPVAYEDLTPSEKQEICNGCGGKGGIVKPPYAAMFKTSCNHHDYGYFKGCTRLDRLKNDLNLFWFLLKDSWSFGFKKPHKVIYFSIWAALYFIGVRLVGWKFFYYGESKRYPKR